MVCTVGVGWDFRAKLQISHYSSQGFSFNLTRSEGWIQTYSTVYGCLTEMFLFHRFYKLHNATYNWDTIKLAQKTILASFHSTERPQLTHLALNKWLLPKLPKPNDIFSTRKELIFNLNAVTVNHNLNSVK